ncbi:MAG: signal peptidase I [Candidatus Berkelbacteria bacterium]|nr:signal peptidase I [Candidatus Berkelbacteria bacterium]
MQEKSEALGIFKSFLRILYELVKTVAFVLLIFFITRYFLVQPFIVDGNSMESNFHDKDYLLVDKLSYKFKDPQRGDVVIFHPPNRSVFYIKRVIGVPGDKIVIQQDGVTIYNIKNPNGVGLKETYLKQLTKTNGSITQTLYDDEYFVLGDNRENSSDSREFGVIPKKNVAGRVFLTVFPFSDFQFIKKIQYSDFSLINLVISR